GFRLLPRLHFRHVLGVGSALGDELSPLTADRVTVIEPASRFRNPKYHYVVPASNGILPFADASFDFVSCLGVLHHLPKVRMAVKEISRVLEPNGYALIREPI